MNKRITFFSFVCILLSSLMSACSDDSTENPLANGETITLSSSSVVGNGNILSSSGTSDGALESSDSVYVVSIKTCKTDLIDTCKYETLTDNRDGQTYKTVKIGYQVWMAENLRFKTDNSVCFKDSIEDCSKYGRYYSWADAMDSAGVYSINGEGCGYHFTTCSPIYPVRGICPEGWHLPQPSEWDELFRVVGGNRVLMATNGWLAHSDSIDSGNGTDFYGFSVTPSGLWFTRFSDVGYEAYFWTSGRLNENTAAAAQIFIGNEQRDPRVDYYRLRYRYSLSSPFAIPVRCVKD